MSTDGTFHSAMTGTFQSDTGGTSILLLSPDKHKVEFRGLLNWAKYQRKRINSGIVPADQQALFKQLMNSRSNEHTGGRKKNNPL